MPTIRTRCLMLVAAAFALALGSAAARAAIFNPETFTLDNGLQVVVVPNHRAPVVTHMVWYKVGAADEVPGKSGLAHFLEHLMFKGTKTLAPGEFSQIVAENGGRENAFTTQDYTAYYQSVAKDRLEIMMKNEADRMANLQLTDDVVLPERDVVLEERRMRVDSDPAAYLRETMDAVLYLNHPYRIPVIGWENEVAKLTTADAIAFYKKWYGPDNAVVVISGDVTADEVRPMAERTYGKLKPIGAKPRVRVEEPKQHAARRVELRHPRVEQPSVTIEYLAPSYERGATEHAYALQVLDEVMGGSATSRLYKDLVVDQGVASSAGSFYSPDKLDLTSFGFYGSPRPGGDVAEVETAIRAEIARVLQDGVTDEEVERAKKRMMASVIYSLDSVSAPARIFGSALTTGRSVEDVEAWPDRIGAVTTEQVNAAARAVFREDYSVTGVLLPDTTS
jgi:zinc protease